jgi:HK97 gp10 family phage protein
MATLQLDGWDELARQLDRVDDQLTKRAKLEAVKAAGEVVAARAKQLCPRGDAADKPDAKPLADTIAVEVRDYDQRALAVIGPQYPAGAHGHLVENGHEIVTRDGRRTGRRARPKPFVRPAFDETQDAQQAAMESVIARTLREIGG